MINSNSVSPAPFEDSRDGAKAGPPANTSSWRELCCAAIGRLFLRKQGTINPSLPHTTPSKLALFSFGDLDLKSVSVDTLADYCAKFPAYGQGKYKPFLYGLYQTHAKKMLKKNGLNEIAKQVERPLWLKFFYSIFSGFSPLIFVACIFVFLSWRPFGNKYNLALAEALAAVFVISGFFNFYQEAQTALQATDFSNLLPPFASVLRDGELQNIASSNLVIGDIVKLSAGSTVPVDVRVIRSESLKIDKSILNGDTEPQALYPDPVPSTTNTFQSANMAFMGCSIVEGEGFGIVITTGAGNELAKMSRQVAMVSNGSVSLQRDINWFVLIIAVLSAITASVCMLVWGFYLQVDHPGYLDTFGAISNAISVLISYVPTGLPLTLSVGMTLIARRMLIVSSLLFKNLNTIETFGNISMLAIDKTGTLTQNNMMATSIISYKDILTVDDSLLIEQTSQEFHHALMRLCIFCNEAKVDDGSSNHHRHRHGRHSKQHDGSEKKSSKSSEKLTQNASAQRKPGALVGGNATDRSLFEMAKQYVEVMMKNYEVKTVMPFSSSTKLAAAVVKTIEESSPSKLKEPSVSTFALIKGAPENILFRCANYLDENGNDCELAPMTIAKIKSTADSLSRSGQRLIALAQIKLQDPTGKAIFSATPYPNFPLYGLTFVGCIAISDAPRPGVKDAIVTIRKANVLTAVITGDAPTTALAVAEQAGIVTAEAHIFSRDFLDKSAATSLKMEAGLLSKKEIDDGDKPAVVLIGDDLLTITPAGWDYVFSHQELVFARVTPEQKVEIVQQGQKRGHLVAYVGDGLNDAPAIKSADIGIAMNCGPSFVRESASVVLLNDNLSEIVQGIREGRLMFANLRKVIGYQIAAGCWSELLPVLVTFFLGMPQPLSSFLMIVISCVTDVFAGIALTHEPPERDIMLDEPRNFKTRPLVTASLIGYAYLFYGTLQSIAGFLVYFLYMSERGPMTIPNPIPADDDGRRQFPAGYSASQLIGAWNFGKNDGRLGADQASASAVASSAFFVALVCSQWGHLCSIRRKLPYFYTSIVNADKDPAPMVSRFCKELVASKPSWRIVVAIVLSAATANMFNEVAFFHRTCDTASVPARYWVISIILSVIIFVIAEIRKWVLVLCSENKTIQRLLFAW